MCCQCLFSVKTIDVLSYVKKLYKGIMVGVPVFDLIQYLRLGQMVITGHHNFVKAVETCVSGDQIDWNVQAFNHTQRNGTYPTIYQIIFISSSDNCKIH